jgi:hypothetical protein
MVRIEASHPDSCWMGSGLFKIPHFLDTLLKFPVKQHEFAKSVVSVMVVSQDILSLFKRIYWDISDHLSLNYLLPGWNLRKQV